MIGIIIAVVFLFHLAMIIPALFVTNRLHMEPGRRESIVFMGIQKTLPLSIILQVSLFPQLGVVLVVCVIHHVVHLMIDGILVNRFKAAHRQ